VWEKRQIYVQIIQKTLLGVFKGEIYRN